MGLFFTLLPLLAMSVATFTLPQHQDAKVIAEVINKFACNLHKKLGAADGNVFVSPLSISTALAMLFYGTRGKTADEMRQALGYQQAGLTDNQVHSAFQNLVETLGENSGPKEYVLYLANAMLTQEGFPILDKYKTGLEQIYKAEVRNVDFERNKKEALKEINDWVKKKTNNQISKLLDDISPETVMILLSAVYFKGKWQTKFEHTKEGTFFNNGIETESVKTTMMYYEKDVLYTPLEGAQAIELPYKGEDISMVIVLPDALNGLQKFEQDLTPNTLENIRNYTHKTTVHVTIPKFKLEYKKNLNSALQDFGIKDIFKNSADLSGISETSNLAVSEVVHKAVIEVNEEGTEASGVTGVGVKLTSANLNEINFVVDHPFLCAIVDRRSGLLMFLGRVKKL